MILLRARQNDVNAMCHFARKSSFCQAHTFKSGHLLQPIANLSFVVFFVKISYQARFCLQLSYCAILFTMLMRFLNQSFLLHVLLPGKSKAFTLSDFLPGTCVHVILPCIRRYYAYNFLMTFLKIVIICQQQT